MSENEKKGGRPALMVILVVLLFVGGAYFLLIPREDPGPAGGGGQSGTGGIDASGEAVATVKFTEPAPPPSPAQPAPPVVKPTGVPKPPSTPPSTVPAKPVAKPLATVPLPDELPQVFDVPGIGMELLLAKPGRFLMGSPADEPRRRDWEVQHEVVLSQPFWLGKYEVTQQQWQFFGNANKNYFKGPRFPIAGVTWFEAVEFCRKLTTHASEAGVLPEGHVFRLPTEAEWEYACRAGTRSTTAYGDAMSSRQANFDGGNPCGGAPRGPFLKRPQPVGFYKANSWGYHDMHGNVWEWCHDIFFTMQPNEQVDPWGIRSGRYRVAKGGGYLYHGWECRSTSRCAMMPSVSYNIGIGFRVALGRPQSFFKKKR